MAHEHIDSAETIGGAKYRSTQKSDGYWTDPLVEQVFYSVTYMPNKTKYEEDQDEDLMLNKVKSKKYKGSDLCDYTKNKFKEKNISYEDDQGEDEQ